MNRSGTHHTTVLIQHNEEIVKKQLEDKGRKYYDKNSYVTVNGSCGQSVQAVKPTYKSIAKVLIKKQILLPYQDNPEYIKKCLRFIYDCGFPSTYIKQSTLDVFEQPNNQNLGHIVHLNIDDYYSNMDLFMGFMAIRYIYSNRHRYKEDGEEYSCIDYAMNIYEKYNIPAFECLQMGLLVIPKGKYYAARSYFKLNNRKPISRKIYEKRIRNYKTIFSTFGSSNIKDVKILRDMIEKEKRIEPEYILEVCGYDKNRR